jgi:hypothetical protein
VSLRPREARVPFGPGVRNNAPMPALPETRELTPGERGAVEDFEAARRAQLGDGKHDFAGGRCTKCGTPTASMGSALRPCPGSAKAPTPEPAKPRERANWLPAPHFFLLNQACLALNDAFGGIHCYLVGSSLHRRDYRDVDVRCILDDEHFDRLFPGAAHDPPRNALWSVMCTSIALMLKEQTGLPIDFQIQRRTNANANPATSGERHALGIFVGYPGGG